MASFEHLIASRAHAIDASGIRRVFDLAADLEDPINLSIGQPAFDVPEPIRDAAIASIQSGRNGYTVTQGSPELRHAIHRTLAEDLPRLAEAIDAGDHAVLVLSGVSGGLVLALMSCCEPGDEVVLPDPYFVMYRHLVTLAGATPVYVDTYPDFQMTAARVEPLLTDRTKMVLFNSPSNPTGVVASGVDTRELLELCRRRGVLLLDDEIYDEFCYEKTPRTHEPSKTRCPSPAEHGADLLLLRGFSKTFGMTGWRLGYAVGPKPIIEQMTKIQQYSFVCAPSMAQAGGVAALDVDMSQYVEAYRRKRDRVIEKLSPVFELARPGGAFYAFPKAPEHLGLTATQFVERAVERGLLIIPGSVFSRRDTHFRISYACDDATLERGLDLLLELAQG